MPLLSYVLTYDRLTLTNTIHSNSLDCLFLCAVQTKQGGYECYHIPTCQVITQRYITVVLAAPTMIATIYALSKSDSIQSLKITDLHGHLSFDSSVDPAFLAGVDDADDKDTSFAEVHDEDTSFAGVPVPNTTIATNADNSSDAESDHNSIDPNEADDNSSKESIHSTGSHLSIHSATSEQPQHPPDEEANLSKDQTKPDDIELPELETQVPMLH